MKRLAFFSNWVFLGLLLGFAAKPCFAAAEIKMGLIDMQSVILTVEEGKQARAVLEKEIKAKEKEFLKKKEDLDKLNEDWKKQAPMLSEAARIKKQQEFQEQFMGMRNEEMTFQNEIKRKEQEATQKIAVSVAGIVEKVAKEKDLYAVFESNSAGLLYLKDPVDVTKDVIARYGKDAPKNDKK